MYILYGLLASSWLTATLNLCLIYFKITRAIAILYEHMHKKFDINRTKIREVGQSGRKLVTHNSKSDLSLVQMSNKKDSSFLIILLITRVLWCSTENWNDYFVNENRTFLLSFPSYNLLFLLYYLKQSVRWPGTYTCSVTCRLNDFSLICTAIPRVTRFQLTRIPLARHFN